MKQQIILTLNVTEKVGADEGEQEHWDRQGTIRQHLPHFGMQERTEKERAREKGGGVSRERQIIKEYNYCGQDKDKGCNPDTA